MANTLRQKRLNQILYISIGSVVGIIIVLTLLFTAINKNSKKRSIQISENNKNNSAPSVEQANSQIGKSIEEAEKENILVNTSENQQNEEENLNANESKSAEKVENKAENINTNNDLQSNNVEVIETEEIIPDPKFIKPVEGEIVKQFGKDKLLYSNTLKEWTTHLGIDIQANKTTIVKASSDGTVKSIKNDPRYGLTIVIEHNNGFKSVYSNLLSTEFVTVGENVKSGQTIGTVGNTAAFEIVEEPHLHFEITKDGENIDPEMYF